MAKLALSLTLLCTLSIPGYAQAVRSAPADSLKEGRSVSRAPDRYWLAPTMRVMTTLARLGHVEKAGP